MITTCWSVKGGSGTTVVTCALALLAARAPVTRAGQRPVLVIDLGHDVGSVIGLAAPSTDGEFGFADWLSADESVGATALERLVTPLNATLSLLSLGASSGEMPWTQSRIDLALTWADQNFVDVIVDAGVAESELARRCVANAHRSLLVMRPCYLSLRSAIDSTLPAHAAIVVSSDGRTLDSHDVSSVLGIPVSAQLPFDPEIARLVDSGSFGQRLPRSVQRLRRVAA
jgi:Flp pilus assembly CpaE family ATPase